MTDYIVNELQQALSALREGLQISAEYHINNALREHKQCLIKRPPDVAKSGKNKSNISGKRPAKSPRRLRKPFGRLEKICCFQVKKKAITYLTQEKGEQNVRLYKENK